MKIPEKLSKVLNEHLPFETASARAIERTIALYIGSTTAGGKIDPLQLRAYCREAKLFDYIADGAKRPGFGANFSANMKKDANYFDGDKTGWTLTAAGKGEAKRIFDKGEAPTRRRGPSGTSAPKKPAKAKPAKPAKDKDKAKAKPAKAKVTTAKKKAAAVKPKAAAKVKKKVKKERPKAAEKSTAADSKTALKRKRRLAPASAGTGTKDIFAPDPADMTTADDAEAVTPVAAATE